jgi:hypothetical protein
MSSVHESSCLVNVLLLFEFRRVIIFGDSRLSIELPSSIIVSFPGQAAKGQFRQDEAARLVYWVNAHETNSNLPVHLDPADLRRMYTSDA